MKKRWAALFLLMLISCGKGGNEAFLESETGGVIESQVKDLKLNFQSSSNKHSWRPGYTQSLLRYLEEKGELSSLLDAKLRQSDLALVGCPGYESATLLEKKRFWVIFMASIAYAESRLNPMTTYQEKDGTLSSGLLQIDVASANRHSFPYTGFRFTQKDLFNTDLNLMAGLYIMKHQVEGGVRGERLDIKNRLFTGRNYYWSVLTYKRELIIKTFSHNSKDNLAFCQDRP